MWAKGRSAVPTCRHRFESPRMLRQRDGHIGGRKKALRYLKRSAALETEYCNAPTLLTTAPIDR